MSSFYGKNLQIALFGQSHSKAIGAVVDGLPAGLRFDFEKLLAFMARRAPGQSPYTTPRKENDRPDFLSGLINHTTTGAPLAFNIYNQDTRSKDYDSLRNKPRPGHADYPARIKYQGYEDGRGGGHFSGRLTAPLCVIGGILLQVLAAEGIQIQASIHSIRGNSQDPWGEIDRARQLKDSVGGLVDCQISGLEVGLGEPKFDGLEARLAHAIYGGIPAIKGLEFGAGFQAANLYGSQHNDAFYYDENGQVKTRTNHHGGVLGGLSTGMPLQLRVAVKPTSSISQEQATIRYDRLENTTLDLKGRHDPCIVPRLLPVLEAVCAIVIYDLKLSQQRS